MDTVAKFRSCLILVAVCLCVHAGGAGWIVEGQLTYVNHFMAPRPVSRKEFNFRVSSDGCRSLIRTTRIDTGDYVESLIDQGTVHTFYHYNSTNLQPGGRPTQTAEVTMREFPRDDASNIGYLWLAYGSACYFDSRTTNRLAPLWIQDDPTLEQNGFTMEAEWSRTETERLPLQVTYMNDGLKRTQRGGVSVAEPWHPPFERGFKHAIYAALDGTNLSGAFIPTEFTFTRNGVRPDGKGGFELAVITHTEAKATSVTEISELELASPGFAGTVGVADYRYMHSNPAVSTLLYPATNGAWPDDKLVGRVYDKQVRMQEKLNKAKETSAPKPERRWIVLSLLALTSGGSLVLLAWLGLRRKSAV